MLSIIILQEKQQLRSTIQQLRSTINRPVGRAATHSSLEREVWGSNPGRSNPTQCCQQLATAATFLRKELCYPGAMTRRWAPPTRYTLRRNTASIMKDLIWFDLRSTILNVTPTLETWHLISRSSILLFDCRRWSLHACDCFITIGLQWKRNQKKKETRVRNMSWRWHCVPILSV